MRVAIVMRGSEFTIDVEPQETVLKIKQKIEQLLSIPIASQTLTIWGWELMDGLDMEDYPIINESTKIDLNINSMLPYPMEQNSKIQITVKFSSRKINIEVDKAETVRSLKEKIHIIDGNPIKKMALFFLGQEMDEEFRYLSDYGISDYAEIVVYLQSMTRMIIDPPSRRLSLIVQTSSSLLNAASIPLEMNDSSTVTELRQLLIIRKMLPPDDYIFIHKQRIMRESCSLRWHGAEDGDCLYVFKGTVSRGGF